jgi:hypothetical protein
MSGVCTFVEIYETNAYQRFYRAVGMMLLFIIDKYFNAIKQ